MAKEAERGREDKKNKVTLKPKEKLAVVKKFAEITKFVASKDKKENKKLKEAAMVKARKFVGTERKATEALNDKREELRKAVDTKKPSTVAAFKAANVKYYEQKAKFD